MCMRVHVCVCVGGRGRAWACVGVHGSARVWVPMRGHAGGRVRVCGRARACVGMQRHVGVWVCGGVKVWGRGGGEEVWVGGWAGRRVGPCC